MSWKSVDENRPQESSWGKLKEGSNYIRIVSEPSGYKSHYNPTTKKSVICLSTETELCSICKMNNQPKSRFVINAFELVIGKDGKFTQERILKHYEFPYTIIKDLEGYRIDPEYKYDSIPGWDVNIKKTTGTEAKDVKYQVIPARKDRPLSKEEKEQMEGFPSPDEMIAKKMEKEGGMPVEETPTKPRPKATIEEEPPVESDSNSSGRVVTADNEESPVDDIPNSEGDENIDLNDIPF